MDFIERWLGLSPDGGNGSTELALLMACASAVLAAVLWRYRRAGARARARARAHRRPGRP